jgi:hypothetical protein
MLTMSATPAMFALKSFIFLYARQVEDTSRPYLCFRRSRFKKKQKYGRGGKRKSCLEDEGFEILS